MRRVGSDPGDVRQLPAEAESVLLRRGPVGNSILPAVLREPIGQGIETPGNPGSPMNHPGAWRFAFTNRQAARVSAHLSRNGEQILVDRFENLGFQDLQLDEGLAIVLDDNLLHLRKLAGLLVLQE